MYQATLLGLTFLGLAGFVALAWLLWPVRREPGGAALGTLVIGLGLGFLWFVVLDAIGMLSGRGVLPFQPARALIYRGIITATVWATLFVMRRRRGS